MHGAYVPGGNSSGLYVWVFVGGVAAEWPSVCLSPGLWCAAVVVVVVDARGSPRGGRPCTGSR